jgi:hypothetical protein
LNWEDVPVKQREVILCQQRTLMAVSFSNIASVASSLTGTTAGVICHSHVILHQDVVVLSTQSSKLQTPIAIHSPMPHLMLQWGGPREEKDCPALRYMLNSSASLSTANFHYM